MEWSPPGWTASISHPAQVSAPSRTGEPALSGDQPTPSNLRGPVRPNLLASSCWSSDSTFTANKFAWAIRGQVVDVSAGQNTTSGGSSDKAANAWQANPTGSPS